MGRLHFLDPLYFIAHGMAEHWFPLVGAGRGLGYLHQRLGYYDTRISDHWKGWDGEWEWGMERVQFLVPIHTKHTVHFSSLFFLSFFLFLSFPFLPPKPNRNRNETKYLPNLTWALLLACPPLPRLPFLPHARVNTSFLSSYAFLSLSLSLYTMPSFTPLQFSYHFGSQLSIEEDRG